MIVSTIGCKTSLRSNTPIDIEQEQHIVGQYELCYNHQIDFENYIVYGPEGNDSVIWLQYTGIPGNWDTIAIGNPVQIPVADQGMFQYLSHTNGDSTFGRFEIVQCFRQVFLSSAFTPHYGGVNSVWKPIIRDDLGTISSYYLRIMTNEGMVVFETGNPQVGWDGTIDGQLGPPGTYLYYLRLEFDDNTYSEYSGELVLTI